ncbi:MAG: DUF5700 domain-containing putative Zn-dependent protease [Pseudomonadota bacterium]
MQQFFLLLAGISSVCMAVPASAEVQVRLDTSFASSVLNDVCSNQAIDEAGIRNSTVVKDMLAHFSKFRDYFTMDEYIAARKSAAACAPPERDYFRFSEVIEKRDDLARIVAALSEQTEGFSDTITQMVSVYTPTGMRYDGVATVIVGGPSCGGWAIDGGFYVDLPCIGDDEEGLRYLIAHEIYHGVQSLFVPVVDDDAPAPLKIFDAIIREGSAITAADFSEIEEPGAYAKLSQRINRNNAGRTDENFDLLDLAFVYLSASDDPAAADRVYNIGLSGVFDSPFYYVGAEMVQAIEKAFGREALLCVMGLQQAEFVFAYAAAIGDDEDVARPLPASVMNAAKAVRSDNATFNSCL